MDDLARLAIDLLIDADHLERDPDYISMDDVERTAYLHTQALLFSPHLRRTLDEFSAQRMESVAEWRTRVPDQQGGA